MQNVIGLFDSGSGGLSVLKALRTALPEIDFVYFADLLRCPYGQRSQEEIRSISFENLSFLKSMCSTVVIACHTSSSVLGPSFLWQDLCVITMLEATLALLKEHAHTPLAFMATPTTITQLFHSENWNLKQHHPNLQPLSCPNLAKEIEDSIHLENTAPCYAQALLSKGVQGVVYGCTHYPFSEPFLSKNLPSSFRYLDPADYIAQQVKTLQPPIPWGTGKVTFYLNQASETFVQNVRQFLKIQEPQIIYKNN
ncbi:MAG: hypothetical protein BGO07_02405 [Alphaproteobacteria bacterium 40-19]|nr:MAG: hypothetical protein BGO07_02405 [Alphaproteobacteria bacterium 40-19]